MRGSLPLVLFFHVYFTLSGDRSVPYALSLRTGRHTHARTHTHTHVPTQMHTQSMEEAAIRLSVRLYTWRMALARLVSSRLG